MTGIRSILCALSLLALSPLYGEGRAPSRPDGTSATAGFNDNIDRMDPNFVKASLLVVDPGEIMYSCFGHAVIRLECPKFNLDYCFSYESESIVDNKWRFFWGDLKMGMFAIPTRDFLKSYAEENRGIRQYALNLPADAKQRLWKYLDGKAAEGTNLKYDQVARCCAQSVFRQITHALGTVPVCYSYWPDGFAGTKTRREIARDFLAGLPWTSFVMSAVSGSVLDEQCSKSEKIIIPDDAVAVFRHATVNGTPIIGEKPVQLLPTHSLTKPGLLTPMVFACVALVLSVVNLFVAHWALDAALLALYSVFALAFFFLVCLSTLPTNGWNWMLLPFNPLPLACWKWRKLWGAAFAVTLAIFAAVVSVMPHRVTEWPYLVFIAAFALLFAKASISPAFLGRARTPSAPQTGKEVSVSERRGS